MECFAKESMEVLIGQVFSNRYVLNKRLGEGGMGCVFQVRTRDMLEADFALKILSKKEYSIFANIYAEVHSLQDLYHSGIPKIVEVKEDEQYVYIVQEFIHGIDLQALVLRYGKVDEAILVFWMEELTEILRYLHLRGVIHRDIKPGNIMINVEGQLKVIDFGLARDLRETDDVDLRVVGTLAHTPPERYIRKSANEQTDIYAYGSTMYFLATGETPLSMKTEEKKNMQKMLRKLKRVVSPAVFNIIKTCMAVDPQNRYRNFDEIEFDIDRVAVYNQYLLKNVQKIKFIGIGGVISFLLGIFFIIKSFYLL